MAKKSTTTDKTKAPAKKVAPKKKVTASAAKTTKPAKKVAAKKAAPAKKTPAKKVIKKVVPAKAAKAPAKKVIKTAPKKAAAKKVAAKKVAVKPAVKAAAKAPTKKAATKTAVKSDKKAVKQGKLSDSEILKNAIVEGMEEMKAENIVVMDLRDVKNAVSDFFVICQAESTTQVDSIANSIWDEVYKTTKEKPWHIEGKDNKQWILVDYVTVVAHIFQPDARHFYNIEKLWADAEFKYIVH